LAPAGTTPKIAPSSTATIAPNLPPITTSVPYRA
jgi:hypothetical protein